MEPWTASGLLQGGAAVNESSPIVLSGNSSNNINDTIIIAHANNTTLATATATNTTTAGTIMKLLTTTMLPAPAGSGLHNNSFSNNSSDLFMTTVISDVTVASTESLLALPHDAWAVFEVLHALLTAVALGANCLSLGIIYGIVMRLTPPLLVLTSLGFADLLAPWAVMVAYFPHGTGLCQEQIQSSLMLLAHDAGALTLLTYALIHSVATYRPLQYERIVTPRRLWTLLALVWVTSLMTSHLHFLAVLLHQEPDVPYCEQVRSHYNLSLIMTAAILSTVVLVTALIYGRLFLHLRPIEALAGGSSEPRHSTKGVVTGVLILALFLLGWGPYLIAKLEDTRQAPHPHPNLLIGLSASQLFVLLMCVAHPVVYGHRMTNMHSGYHRLFQRCRGWFVTSWIRVRSKAEGEDQPSTPLNPIESIC